MPIIADVASSSGSEDTSSLPAAPSGPLSEANALNVSSVELHFRQDELEGPNRPQRDTEHQELVELLYGEATANQVAERLAQMRADALALYSAVGERLASALRVFGVDPADTERVREVADLYGIDLDDVENNPAVAAALAALNQDAAGLAAATGKPDAYYTCDFTAELAPHSSTSSTEEAWKGWDPPAERDAFDDTALTREELAVDLVAGLAAGTVSEMDLALAALDEPMAELIREQLVVRYLADVAAVYDVVDAEEAEAIIRTWHLPPHRDILHLLLSLKPDSQLADTLPAGVA